MSAAAERPRNLDAAPEPTAWDHAVADIDVTAKRIIADIRAEIDRTEKLTGKMMRRKERLERLHPLWGTGAGGVLRERPHITPTAATGFLGAMCGILDAAREAAE